MNGLRSVQNRIKDMRPAGWVMCGVLVVAALLRFFHLGAESLWLDELTTLLQTSWAPGRIIAESVVRGTPPLYYLLEKFAYNTLPASESSLRAISAVADVVSVYLVFAVGRRVIGEWPAVVAAGFSAVAIRLIWFAQEARAYSLGMMFSLLAALTLLHLIERPSWRTSLLHLAAVVAVLYTHVYSTIAVIGIELVVLLSPRLLKRLGKYWWWAAVGAVLSYVPWTIALLGQIGHRAQMASQGAWTIEAPSDLMQTVFRAISDFTPGVYASIPDRGPGGWTTYLFVAIVLFGLFASGRSSDDTETRLDPGVLTEWERRVFLLGWAGALLVGGVLLSMHILPIFSWRMAAQAAPPVFMAAASGLRRLWRPAAVVVVVAFAVLALSGLRPYYLDRGPGQSVEKENWRGALEYVSHNAGPHDVVLVTASWFTNRVAAYAEMKHIELPPLVGVRRELDAFEISEQIADSTASASRVIVLASHAPIDSKGLTAVDVELIAQGWHEAGRSGSRGLAVRTYER